MPVPGIEALGERAARQAIPLEGMFELTQKCNLRCKFCYVCDRSAQPEKSPEKTTAEWLYMIRDAADAGMLLCTFTGGEPFLREDFEEIYCKAYDMGLRIAIFTNAVLIGQPQIAYLRRRKPHYLSISLYGASEHSYRKICGTSGSFHRALASIGALCAAGVQVEIKALALRPLLEEYEAIGRIAADHHCPVKIDMYLGSGRDDPQRLIRQWQIPLPQMASALDSLKKGYQKPSAQRRSSPPDLNGPARMIPAVPCMAGKRTFAITHDGRMLGCPTLTCFETSPFEHGFRAAWAQLVEMVKNAQPCQECNYCPDMDACYLCPANRMKETGSIALCSAYLKELAHTLSLQTQGHAG